ncbi:MAG: urea carboxylase-associated family protein [Dehalococcoidia bacterium]|nr:urea carboxylase-associated family protein [Dehalococcoidia bacterium]
MSLTRIAPQAGIAFVVPAGATLTLSAPEGEQVADLVAFGEERREWLSAGRTFDYASSIRLSTGDVLFSNRSRPMLEIVEDTVGQNDFLLAPCSPEMFRRLYGVESPHPSCFENLVAALRPFGIEPDQVPTAFNVFMNVQVDRDGRLSVQPPAVRPGDRLTLRVLADVVVGVTACSAELTNNGSFKPIDVLLNSRPG